MNFKQKKFDISFRSFTILALLILFLSILFIYFNYQNKIFETDRIKNILVLQNKKISLLEERINSLRFESDGKVQDLKKKIDAEELLRKTIESKRKIQEEASQQKISNLETKLSGTSISQDLSAIIKNWEPKVAYIECHSVMKNSYLNYTTNGSGIIFKFSDEPIKVLTNRHVLISPNLYDLNYCNVTLSGSNETFVVGASDIEVSLNEYDWGTLIINNPDENMNAVASTFINFCEQKPKLGDTVVVLGYPSIGSKDSVTATEGIISGFDGNYFITSAKVEQGNSGGAAILSKNNCLLGIPTYASLGQVESLARILDIWTIITK